MTGGARHDIAVVGAGPAGSVMASELAKSGARVLLFDHSHPRAKPCSGFLTKEVFDLYKPLRDFHDHRPFDGRRSYTTPKGRSFSIASHQALTQFNLSSRLLFDQFLLDDALQCGAALKKKKVTSVERSKSGWKIETSEGVYAADIIVGADGVRSVVRKSLIGPIPRQDIVVGVGATYHKYAHEELDTVFLKSGGIGFVLPGYNFSQIVIACRLNTARKMTFLLKTFRESLSGKWSRPAKVWMGLQPSPVSKDFFKAKCAGDNYCLIGDAAGHCDSLNGEGVPFAIRGAMLAAKAIIEGHPERFDELWRDSFGLRLEQASRKTRRAPGANFINLAGWALSKSPSLIDIAVSHAAKERQLKNILLKALARSPKIIAELIKG
jgi:flavin-dependent dehydrogenase